MASGFEKPISVKEAIDKIDEGTYLLPDIQREYVWTSDKIERLFDSLLRGYPINSFMFWYITEDSIKNNFRFYKFLTRYIEFHETNPEYCNTAGYKDFYAIIDGQQRLTSLYLGLKGSYAYKLKWKQKGKSSSKKNFPERHLYINILKELNPEKNERQMKYDIRFLTLEQYEEKTKDSDAYWFKFNKILELKNPNELLKFIRKQPWEANENAVDIINIIWNKIYQDKVINYYLEESQEVDKVLDIFIRTNSGGQPLSLSDLLMSLISSIWEGAKEDVSDLIKDVYSESGFKIGKDFVLKTFLVLYNNNIKFSVNNFDKKNILLLKENWNKFENSIISAFNLLKKWGFVDASLRAKNAIIPIIYFIYYNNIEESINNPIRYEIPKKNIRKWLCISLLKGIFGGQSDNVLSNIRNILEKYKGKQVFPFNEIQEKFKSDPAKNLTLTDEYIESLLTIQKGTSESYPILALIYSHLNFDDDQKYDQDHLHPESYFQKNKNNKNIDEFYKNRENWNSILNLQLVNQSINRSKNDDPLKKWIEEKKVDLDNQLIPKDASLEIEDFKDFIEKRKLLLIQHIKQKLE